MAFIFIGLVAKRLSNGQSRKARFISFFLSVHTQQKVAGMPRIFGMHIGEIPSEPEKHFNETKDGVHETQNATHKDKPIATATPSKVRDSK